MANKKPIPKRLQINGDTVEALAKEMGIPLKRYRYKALDILNDASKRDPDIAYLVDPLELDTADCMEDAMLYWKNRNNSLKWDDHTKPSIRKIFEDDGSDSDCCVCYEDLPIREALNCTKCNCKICSECLMKLCMGTPESILRILSGNFLSGHTCPECRNESAYDFRTMYHRVLDRLEKFTDEQQRAIKFADHHSPLRNTLINAWILKHPLVYFKPGVTVKLGHLRKQRKWNGRKAKIIGPAVIKDDILRWPIRLVGKKGTKALLKQCNMTPPLNATNLYHYDDPY